MKATMVAGGIFCECGTSMRFTLPENTIQCGNTRCKHAGILYHAPTVDLHPVVLHVTEGAAPDAKGAARNQPWPMRDTELLNRGYRFVNTGRCSGARCSAAIEWWITPSGSKMPLVKHAESTDDKPLLMPHFADCVDKARFS